MSRDAIADLVHRYADGVVRRDAEQWAACWAEEATWSLPGGRVVSGRDAIVAMWAAAMDRFEAVVQVVHNGTARLDGDEGEGRWYISEAFRRAGGEPGILVAAYDDTYVQVAGEWRFAGRHLDVQYQGPPDLSAPFLVAGGGGR